jgi:hypothetical protein
VSGYTDVREVIEATRDALHAWAGGLLRDAGAPLPVSGSATAPRSGPTLVILPYQTVLESQATTPIVAIVPSFQDGERSSIPEPWRTASRTMTHLLVEHYPKREARGPGIGTLDPLPLLKELPKPLAAWYEAQGAPWVVDRGGKPAGRLPFVGWRHPFSLAVRFAVFVLDGPEPAADLDRVTLGALGVIAAGIRLERFVRVEAPAVACPPPLADLVRAFSALDADAARQLREAFEGAGARPLAVGLTPHHELTDSDLAAIARTLGGPIQPALVFSLRVALGAGPDLAAGALPHIGAVGMVERDGA